MGLWTPNSMNEYQKILTSVSVPSSIMGTEIAPGPGGTEGAWVEVLNSSQVNFDVYGIIIYFNTVAVSAEARDNFDDVGIDPAGGTSYSPLISNLISSNAGTGGMGPGHSYYFPIFIPAGSSIAVRAVSNAGGSHEVWLQLFGKPTEPQKTWVGTECQDWSSGATITSGTTSEGAWTSLGTLTKDYHWWQASIGISDTTMTNGNIYHLDIAYGDASNKHIIMQDIRYMVTSAGETTATTGFASSCFRTVKSGATIYARVQCSGTPDSNIYPGVWAVR